jgi:hypothetical protein
MFATNSSINQQVTLFCQIAQHVVFKPLSVKYQQSLERSGDFRHSYCPAQEAGAPLAFKTSFQ